MLNHGGTQILESKNLILRRFEYSDGDEMLKNWVSDIKIQSLISEPVYSSKQEVAELLNKWISSYSSLEYYRWAIIEKSTNICIGQIAIFLVDNKNHFCEIEYALGSNFHRRGYGTEAVGMILDYAFNQINFHKVQVCHKEGNLASQGVIRKNNFTYEGTLRDFFYVDCKYVSRLYYSILRSEYNKQALK